MWTMVSEQRVVKKEHQAALITSPEYAMKKLLAAGLDKIYDLGPCFRDGEPWDGSHDVEFLMIEWYRKFASLSDLMDETEAMVRTVNGAISNTEFVISNAPFRRLTVAEAMKKYANVDLDPLLGDREAMAEVVQAHGQTVDEKDTWDDLFFKIFLSEVETKLGEVPTFLWDYPASMAALARRDPDDSRYALRVELYIGKFELANGFAELADAVEQRKRFEEERDLRASLGKKTWPLDERFLSALPQMGDAVGIAFGVDRLTMLIAGTDSISDLMPIPVQERF
jgi:lysyl-tRNA synthetase class 2